MIELSVGTFTLGFGALDVVVDSVVVVVGVVVFVVSWPKHI